MHSADLYRGYNPEAGRALQKAEQALMKIQALEDKVDVLTTVVVALINEQDVSEEVKKNVIGRIIKSNAD